MKPSDSFALRFYGQPKINKAGVPIRSIVSLNDSPLYNLDKYMPNILKAYVKNENNNTNNPTTFSNYIRNASTEHDNMIVSFDATSWH